MDREHPMCDEPARERPVAEADDVTGTDALRRSAMADQDVPRVDRRPHAVRIVDERSVPGQARQEKQREQRKRQRA
jgi:hypothetical protein